jgi:uncharacterized damage-inducible protein DinB
MTKTPCAKQAEPEFEVCGEAKHGLEAIEEAENLMPHQRNECHIQSSQKFRSVHCTLRHMITADPLTFGQFDHIGESNGCLQMARM